jgi:hypothetical protein
MRALALHVIALAMFMVANSGGPLTADEFEIFDDGAASGSFEVADDGDVGKPSRTEDFGRPLDSYPDPVVDQPQASATPELTSAVVTDGVTDSQQEPAYTEAPAESFAQPYLPQSAWDSQQDLGDVGYALDEAAYGAEQGCGDGCGGSNCGGCCGARRPGTFIDFWVSGGFTYNDAKPANGFNSPVTFNDFSDQGQFNQLYLGFGRAVDKCSRCWDIGGRIDLLYGTDYFFATAAGLETHANGAPHWNSGNGSRRRSGFTFEDYGLAMPQVYAEIFAPIGTGLDIKIGHFYTILGYESVRAPENFFYSHSYTFQYGKPITHTGVLADWAFGSKLNFQFGWTRGWDNWEDLNGRPNYLAGVTWCPSQTASLAFALSTGSEDIEGLNNRTVYTLVYTRRMGAVTYVFEHTLGTEENAEFDNEFQRDTAKWYGINQYLFTDISEKLTTGMRIEWFRDQDNARVLQLPLESAVSGGNYVGLTLGFNWRPTCNLIVRPELRYDYSDVEPFGFGNNGVYNDFTSRDQLTLAIDAIFRF